ncbi:methyltransferase [Bdellovibrio bacteriovorus]|uniref:methyltransferase n=1 Tax=Bdellovibrio bacteriovorus TaxID=959 RepID=UPI0035A72287
MSSINPHYTFQYSQPEEYRFSHDSVFLARRVFEFVKDDDWDQARGLDLCSGCGIIGLDFLFHLQNETGKSLAAFDFLEVQSLYHDHFTKNLCELGETKTACHFINDNYQVLSTEPFKESYDIVLSNPPYFQVGQGKLSPSEFKNRCRFFIDSDFRSLILGIENSLAPQGRAFVLLRSLADHGMSYLKEAERLVSKRVSIQSLGDIRGTDLVLLKKD